jgi:hypothetical protein
MSSTAMGHQSEAVTNVYLDSFERRWTLFSTLCCSGYNTVGRSTGFFHKSFMVNTVDLACLRPGILRICTVI